MTWPTPLPGLVIRYQYLWSDEARQGLEEGGKARPCVVVLTIEAKDDGLEVVVAPITHSPAEDAVRIRLPPRTRRRIGLDAQEQWVVVSDLNRFRWPGPDLRPLPGEGEASVALGVLPALMLEEIKATLIDLLKRRLSTVTRRTE